MSLVWLALINNKNKFNREDKLKLAEHVYELEKTFGGVNGKQDQYAAALGGINFMEFKKNKVKVTRLNLSSSLIEQLENNLVLVYTGKSHISGSSNKNVMDNLLKNKNLNNFLAVKKIAYEMKKALLKNNLTKFAELMNQETKEREKFSKFTVP